MRLRPHARAAPAEQSASLTEVAIVSEDAYELLQRGRELLAQRHAHQAAVVLERAQTHVPDSASVRETLARAYYAAGRYAAARDQFRETVERDPANDYGHFGLALSLLKTGDRDRAVGHLRLAVAMRPHSKTYTRALTGLTGRSNPPAAAQPSDAPGDA